jgi:hypothetical protein
MSDKPVAERLQVKGARRLAVLNAPAELEDMIGVAGARADPAEADVVLLFAADRARFDGELPSLLKKCGRMPSYGWHTPSSRPGLPAISAGTSFTRRRRRSGWIR